VFVERVRGVLVRATRFTRGSFRTLTAAQSQGWSIMAVTLGRVRYSRAVRLIILLPSQRLTATFYKFVRRGLHTGIHTKNFSCTHACILCAHARVDTSEFEDKARASLVHLRSRRAQTRLNKRASVVSSHADHRSEQRCNCGPHPAHGFKQKYQESVCLPTTAQ
jgi:hypothetical protein